MASKRLVVKGEDPPAPLQAHEIMMLILIAFIWLFIGLDYTNTVATMPEVAFVKKDGTITDDVYDGLTDEEVAQLKDDLAQNTFQLVSYNEVIDVLAPNPNVFGTDTSQFLANPYAADEKGRVIVEKKPASLSFREAFLRNQCTDLSLSETRDFLCTRDIDSNLAFSAALRKQKLRGARQNTEYTINELPNYRKCLRNMVLKQPSLQAKVPANFYNTVTDSRVTLDSSNPDYDVKVSIDYLCTNR